MNEQISELNEQISQLNEQNSGLNEQISSLNEQLCLQVTHNHELEDRNHLLERKYEEIVSSTIWRATAPLRAIKDAFVPNDN